jgi:hypothetical protein
MGKDSMITEGLTDEYIEEHACSTFGCGNWAAPGIIYCEKCMHGGPNRMSKAVAQRKFDLETKRMKPCDPVARKQLSPFAQNHINKH